MCVLHMVCICNACFIGIERIKKMEISLFDGFFKFSIDWKAVVGIGLIVLGYGLIKMF